MVHVCLRGERKGINWVEGTEVMKAGMSLENMRGADRYRGV